VLIMATTRAAQVIGDAPLRRTVQGPSSWGSATSARFDVVPLPPTGSTASWCPGDFVTAEDGSGLVHMAPAFGADD
jgi:isoleucyl-tRNA synthetase